MHVHLKLKEASRRNPADVCGKDDLRVPPLHWLAGWELCDPAGDNATWVMVYNSNTGVAD